MEYSVNIVLITTYLLATCSAEPQLKLVNVIFRHGDRTPTQDSMYPKDPYYNSGFYPYGVGRLTNSGKSRCYRLGEFLRERYSDFLGDVYLPDLLYARSTDYDRTKMTLQLVLAALFPPTGLQKWHETLNWQPIPISYLPVKYDDLLSSLHTAKFAKEKKRIEMQVDIQQLIADLREFMDELTVHTGKNITSPLGMKFIHDTLLAESYMNLTLPEWTNGIFPNGRLLEGKLLDYDIITYDNNITSALTGKLMSKMTNDMLARTQSSERESTKLYLYSGHEVNVAATLRSLGIYKTHEPRYTSGVIMELIEENNKYYVKVLYYLGIPSKAIEVQLPGCPILCPLPKYLEIVNDVLAPDEN